MSAGSLAPRSRLLPKYNRRPVSDEWCGRSSRSSRSTCSRSRFPPRRSPCATGYDDGVLGCGAGAGQCRSGPGQSSVRPAISRPCPKPRNGSCPDDAAGSAGAAGRSRAISRRFLARLRCGSAVESSSAGGLRVGSARWNLALIQRSASIWRSIVSRATWCPRRGQAQGQSVGEDRARGARRHRALRPHRCRAGRRPALVERSLHGRARRPALRARHLRHEGLHRLALALVPEMLARPLKRPIHCASPMTKRSAAWACRT